MDADHYRENIAATNRQIVDAKADIAKQRKIIEDLNWSGGETDLLLGESMLETLEGWMPSSPRTSSRGAHGLPQKRGA